MDLAGEKLDNFYLGRCSYLTLDMLLANLVASSAIENETINVFSLRSSLTQRLGITLEQAYPSSDG